MALFDFLKPKQKIVQQPASITSGRPECDITKTRLVVELLNVPRAKRDDSWYTSFYTNVATASFQCDSPQLLTGPDGFTYFILKTPEEDKPFESFCIRNMTEDFLLNNGWGVVFNPKEDNSSDWVFTYGSIVNYHLNKEFYSVTEEAAIENIEFVKNVGAIKKAEKVFVAQPSEDYLPLATKHALKIFLQSKGIKTPKLMMLTSAGEGKITRKLVLNIHPENYPVTSKLDYLMQQVGWFLPNNYLLLPLPKNSELASGFHDM
ncbi:MAG: hypothetical protein ABIN94_01515 [Ferruginibacter sp.]